MGFPASVHLKGGQVAAATHVQAAREFYAPIIPIVAELHRQGLSLREIARELDNRGIRTRQEWPHWSATQVRRVLARALEAERTARKAKAAELLERCRALGISFSVENGRLVYCTGSLEPDAELLQALRSDLYDADLMVLLAQDDGPDGERPPEKQSPQTTR
jgi:hypothetical protein